MSMASSMVRCQSTLKRSVRVTMLCRKSRNVPKDFEHIAEK